MHKQPKARKRTLKAAKIAFDDQRSTIGCTVHNVSHRGAYLKVETTAGIPDRFTLAIEGDDRDLPCSVIWRLPKQMGVHFGEP